MNVGYLFVDDKCSICGRTFYATNVVDYTVGNHVYSHHADVCYNCCHAITECNAYAIVKGMKTYHDYEFIECCKCHVVHKVKQHSTDKITTPVVCHQKDGGCGRNENETAYVIYVNVKE